MNGEKVDYRKECLVVFYFVNEKNKLLELFYNRPKHVDDVALNWCQLE